MSVGFIVCEDGSSDNTKDILRRPAKELDPQGFWKFWNGRESSDIIIGWRVQRADTFTRKSCSRFFYYCSQAVFRTPVHDPSFAYVLTKKPVVTQLVQNMGAMQNGYFWEFIARAPRGGFQITERPVHHRRRSTEAHSTTGTRCRESFLDTSRPSTDLG